MKLYANPDDARRELRMRPVERAGIYVVKDAAGIHDARHFRAGDQVPAAYTFSHERDPRAARIPVRGPVKTGKATGTKAEETRDTT